MPIDANIGRAPVQFAGVSNGESLCKSSYSSRCVIERLSDQSFDGSMANIKLGVLADKASPNSSSNEQTPLIPMAGHDDLMADIDWVRRLFLHREIHVNHY